jgi:hypothetical protein
MIAPSTTFEGLAAMRPVEKAGCKLFNEVRRAEKNLR